MKLRNRELGLEARTTHGPDMDTSCSVSGHIVLLEICLAALLGTVPIQINSQAQDDRERRRSWPFALSHARHTMANARAY